MLDLDQVESQFRASVKVRAVITRPDVAKALIIHDLEGDAAERFVNRVRAYLHTLDDEQLVEWEVAGKAEVDGVRSMLARVEETKPDLIVTYRLLFEDEQDLPFSLGTYADMLTQATSSPVLLLPPPHHDAFVRTTENTDRVLVVTNHIVGDSELVSWGLRLVEKGGELSFAHVEDDAVFERYIEAIGKIADLDTEIAKREIERTLLQEAKGYLEEAAAAIAKDHPNVKTKLTVRRGHTVKDFEEIVEDGQHDIVVFHTKDEGQLAMHGVAYSLAVELNHRALLLL